MRRTLLKKTAPQPWRTALSRSASLKMMSGLFPPNSRLHFFMFDRAQLEVESFRFQPHKVTL